MPKKKWSEEVKVGSGFRIVIPITIRNLVGLKVGDKVKISLSRGNKIVIEKEDEKK